MNRESRVVAPGPDGAAASRSGSAALLGRTTDLLAGYELLAEVGRGALATVYRVRAPGSGSEYALKILDAPSGRDTGPDSPTVAFRREAALLASVNHPGLPRIHEVGTVGRRAYLVMDLVDGESLADVLARGRLTPEQVITLAIDLVEPLAAVHRIGVVHRDIKPDNIMVQPDGTARLIDFGLAARETDRRDDDAVGTLAYCPPEQAGTLKRPVCNRSDLYSMGAVMFECLAGRPPFPTNDVSELLRMHAVTPAPDLRGIVRDIPPALADMVMILMAKDPDDRYQNGEELLADLHRLADAPQVPLTLRAGPDAVRRDVRQPLVGRATELSRLSRPWMAARAGTGAACVIRGGAGAGKSRLATELSRLATASHALVLRGKSSVDDAVPLAPLREAVDAYLRDAERLPERDKADVHRRIRACAGDAAALVGNLSPGLEAVLGPSQPADADRQDQFTLAVVGFLTALAREFGALLLVLDDIQWLDPGTSRVLTRLADDLRDTPLLVLATARDDDEESIAATNAVVAVLDRAIDLDLTLGPLTEAGIAELVTALIPGIDVDARLVRLLSARSKGSPFVVQEYLRAIVDAGLLRPSWGAWLLDEDGLDALELPHDALGLVLARVRGLGAQVRSFLVTAATAGASFRPDLIAAVHGVELTVVLEALLESAGRGLVEARAAGQYAFLHDRIREALLEESDPTGHRTALHARIAAVLDSTPGPATARPAEQVFEVAHHFMAAGPHAPPSAARRSCLAAGILALRTYSPAKAVTLLNHVLALTPQPDAHLLVQLGSALKQVGQFGRSAEMLERALLLEPDAYRRAAIYALLSDVHRSIWSLEAAIEAVENGLTEMGARLPRNRFALVATTLMMFVAAVLMRLTRLGFGRATGSERERCERIAALHEAGSYVGVLSMRTSQLLTHNLRVLYWINRLGSGTQYARSISVFAFGCGAVGLRRSALRNFDRADADPAMADPAVRAITAHYRGASLHLGYLDNGEAWQQAIEKHGRWLDLAAYADAVSIFIVDAASWGRTREALFWWHHGRRRLALNTGEPTSLFVIPAILAAAVGRPADAAAELREVTKVARNSPTLGSAVLRSMTELYVLAEQNETGAPFDQAVTDFMALKRWQITMIRTHRTIQYTIAMGRLAQVRAAGEANRPVRLAQARAAVRALRVARRHPHHVARERIARADLMVLDGKPGPALRLLDRTRLTGSRDTPILAYEAARIRARALRALDALDEANRQALLAIAIAEYEGWPHRAGWVGIEFPAARRRTASPSSHSIAEPGGGHAHGDGRPARDVERERLRALEEVGKAASRVLDPRELARIALDETIRILRADRAFLFLTTADGEALVPHLGRDSTGNDVGELTGYSASLVQRVRETREPLVVTGTDEGAALGAQSAVLHGLRSIMVAPLRLDDRLLGVVYLDSQVAKGIFTADDAGILIALTNYVATSLETARAAQLEISVQTARRQRDLAEQLRAAFEGMSDTLEADTILARLLRSARDLLDCDRAWLLAADTADGCNLTESGFYGETTRAVPADRTTAALLARESPGAGMDIVIPRAIAGRLPGARAWLVVPLRSRTTNIGVLVLGSTEPDHLAHRAEVASALVAHCLTAYDNASLFARVQTLAVVDDLTGIANRRRFLEMADRDLVAAIRHGRPLAAMMIDIDHFKNINDTYGHPTGDDVIRVVAKRLSEYARRTDLLGRYGGEEFALVLPETATRTCHDLAERLRAGVADVPIETRSGPLPVTISVGITARIPSDRDLSDLLARADEALYSAKNAGRNQVIAA